MPRVKSSAHGISVGLGGLAIGNDD
jgi:hypothetical protein